MNNYIVLKGDNLHSIAKRSNISLKQLLDANTNIKNPNTIFIGQKINIPDTRDIEKGKIQKPIIIKVSRNKLYSTLPYLTPPPPLP